MNEILKRIEHNDYWILNSCPYFKRMLLNSDESMWKGWEMIVRIDIKKEENDVLN